MAIKKKSPAKAVTKNKKKTKAKPAKKTSVKSSKPAAKAKKVSPKSKATTKTGIGAKPKLKIGNLAAVKTKSSSTPLLKGPTVVPVKRGLVSRDARTLAENYDEFQHDSEVTEIIKANPLSILRVDMAHCNPESGLDDSESPETIARARQELALLKPQFKEVSDFFFIYRISVKGRPAASQLGLGAHVATKTIHDPSENPTGTVIRNEAIFPHKAEGRSRLIKGLGAVIGTVNLCAPDEDQTLQRTLEGLIAGRSCDIGGPDRKGDRHEVWLITDNSQKEKLSALYSGREFFVADGNHRSKAAQMLRLPHFLAVIFCGQTMNIDPYHRLLADLPFPTETFLAELRKAGFKVSPNPLSGPYHAAETHKMGLYTGGKWYVLEPENLTGLDARASIDAQIIEDRLIKGLLGREPGDKRIAYVGGDYNPTYLQKKVDDGTYQAALSMPAMTMKEFYRINQSRQMLPRKTTWFTPKIRSGLVISLLN